MELVIGSHVIGAGRPCFVIAEAGVNHNGDVAIAKRLVDVAVDAKADAVKFQSFRAELLASASAHKADYQVATTGQEGSQLDMLRKLELSTAAHHELHDYCGRRGIMFLSTPFDLESAQLLLSLGVKGLKLSSGEVTNMPFLTQVAAFGLPTILSTGMSYLSEVDEAVRCFYSAGNRQLGLLHCVSNYPTEPGAVNLRAMQTLAAAFGVPTGFSDHTRGLEVAFAAVALGAQIIEKHFTLDRQLPGPDHAASLEPLELAAMVSGIRAVEAALGSPIKEPQACEFGNRVPGRRSLAAKRDLAASTVLAASDLIEMRPATGIAPGMQALVVGRSLRRALARGEILSWQDLS